MILQNAMDPVSVSKLINTPRYSKSKDINLKKTRSENSWLLLFVVCCVWLCLVVVSGPQKRFPSVPACLLWAPPAGSALAWWATASVDGVAPGDEVWIVLHFVEDTLAQETTPTIQYNSLQNAVDRLDPLRSPERFQIHKHFTILHKQ